MAIAYWIFVSFLIIGTFIDFEHFIIPDRVTIGGTIAGVACSVVVPALMQTDSRVAAGIRAALAAALGYVILWIVLEAGKIAFGRKRIEFDAPTPFTWTKRDDDADFVVGTEESLWSEYFAREKDRLLLQCDEVRIDDREYGNVTLAFRYDRVNADGHVLMLDDVTHISGVTRELVIPREAMGRGDLKFLAAIGAFLGWRAVLFSLFRRITSRFSDRLGHACRGKTCLVSETTVWTLSGIRRTGLDVFWRNRSALVRNAAQPVMPSGRVER